ncbi:MAG: hypothetical protein LBG16_04580, partial [Elusimicrobiota bacterium]|nr:hypothetical protein [Elusimicrobiota bacterium]
MKKLILLFVCVLGFSQMSFAATEYIEEPEKTCEMEAIACDPATQHECWVDGGWWCNGVESFGLIKTCCDG